MKTALAAVRIAALVSAAWIASAPAPALARTAQEIDACVRGNLPERTTHQKVRFRAVDRLGKANVSQAEIFWRRFDDDSRSLLRFGAPPDIRGSALLVIQRPDRNDLFMYLPELQKVRRVTGRSVAGSILGTDFSYEDFERLQGLYGEHDSKLLPEADVDGRAVWVVESRPFRGDESMYERIVSYVDKETCVPLKTELYEQGDRLRKVMKAPEEKVVKRGRSHFPTLVLMKDVIDDTYTELTIDELEIDTEVPQKLFSERELQQSGR